MTTSATGHTVCALVAPNIFKLRDDNGHSFVEIPIMRHRYETGKQLRNTYIEQQLAAERDDQTARGSVLDL